MLAVLDRLKDHLQPLSRTCRVANKGPTDRRGSHRPDRLVFIVEAYRGESDTSGRSACGRQLGFCMNGICEHEAEVRNACVCSHSSL